MTDKMSTELEIAQKVAAGELPSPVPFGRMWLVNLRITGTGLAYRAGLEEIVWRDPKLYLNDEFVKRCNGLPVVVNHPEDNQLTDEEFKARICGTVMLAYLKGEEVWAVCRIYDKQLVAMIMEGNVSTSPGVVFDEGSGNIELEGDDDNLLIEGKPYLIDHIALVTPKEGSLGVWDKQNIPEGIELTSVEENLDMDEEGKKLLAQLIASAVGEAMKPVNDRMGKISSRMDSLGGILAGEDTREDSRRDSRHDDRRDDKRGDASRCDDSRSEDDIRAEISRLEKLLHREDIDSEHEREGMERRDSRNDAENDGRPHFSKEPRVKEQLNRANEHETGRDDSRRGDDNKIDPGLAHERERVGMEHYDERRDSRRDDARGDKDKIDPGLLHERERVGMERYERDRDDSRRDSRHDAADFDGHHIDVRDDEKMSEARTRADSAFRAIGQDAPVPFRGESSLSYRRRALAVMQKHSVKHKGVDIRAIGDAAALAVVEDAIYSDARQCIEHQLNNTPGQLVAITRSDAAGRKILEFKGDMNSWLSAFKQPGRVMERINTNPTQRA